MKQNKLIYSNTWISCQGNWFSRTSRFITKGLSKLSPHLSCMSGLIFALEELYVVHDLSLISEWIPICSNLLLFAR